MKIQKYIPFSFILILFFLSFGKIYADSALVKQYLENLRNSESWQVWYILWEIFYDTTDPLKEWKIKQEYLDLEWLSWSSSWWGTAWVTSINWRDGVVTLTKSDVWLSNVENTALSTWTGSVNITSIWTLSSWVVPWARLSWVPNSSTSAAWIVQLNNSLTSTSTVQALTAAQWKILQDTKENLSNKSTSTTLGTSNTLYPTQNAVKTYVDTSIASISSPVTSVNSKTWAVVLTKNDIWLWSVDNTADVNKNVLSATRFTTARTINGVSFNGTANITLPTVNTSGNQTVWGIKTFSSNVMAPNPTASNHLTTKAYVDTMIWSTNSLYEPIFSTWLTTQYLRWDKTWQTLNTTNVSEWTNLYFTNSRAQASITWWASSVATSNLTINRALISDANWKIWVSSVTSTQLWYLAWATSSIQNQLNGKSPLVSPNFTWTPTAPTAVAWTNTTQIATTAFVQWQWFLKNWDLPVTSVNSKTWAVVLTKSDVWLWSVDNTADVSKNVLSATRFTTARTINGVSFNGTANITLPTVNTSGNQSIAWVKTFSSFPVTPSSNPTTAYQVANKSYVDGQITSLSLQTWVTSVNSKTWAVVLTKSDVWLWSVDNTSDASKNVLSATRFTTARTINWVSFNGTANITLPTVNTSWTQTIAWVKTFSNGTIITAWEWTYNAPNFWVSNLWALNIRQTTSDRRNGITFSSAWSANAQAWIYVHQDNSNWTHMYLATTNSYATWPQARLAILNNWNVWVWTTTPSAKLHVVWNIIASNPTASNHLATKAYVDSVAWGWATPVHGTCGTSHYWTFVTTPTTWLCSSWTNTTVTYNSTSRRFLWSCNGANNWANASCYADKADCASTTKTYNSTSYPIPFGKIWDTYTIFDTGGTINQCPVWTNFVWDVQYVCRSTGSWDLQDNSRCSGSSNEF